MKAEAEIEGNGVNWWYVCSECHVMIEEEEVTPCPNCQAEVSWDGVLLKGKQIFRGEQTEPAE